MIVLQGKADILAAYPGVGVQSRPNSGSSKLVIVITTAPQATLEAIAADYRFVPLTVFPLQLADYQAGLLAGLDNWANQWTVTLTYKGVTYTLPADEMGQNGFARRTLATTLPGAASTVTFADATGKLWTLAMADYQALMAMYGPACIALETGSTGYYALKAAIQAATTPAQLDAITIGS